MGISMGINGTERIASATTFEIVRPDTLATGVVVQMSDHPTEKETSMTQLSRSHVKSFFLLIAVSLTIALLFSGPAAIGQE